MSDTLSNPAIDLGNTPGVDVWRYPVAPEVADPYNPAAAARAEYNQHRYVEQLANETAADGVFTGRDGNAIDPLHAEAVLNATADVVNAYGETAERPHTYTLEQHEAAVAQAQIYGNRIGDMRDQAIIVWGANSEGAQ